MKAKLRVEGNDGGRSLKADDEYLGDSEWIRKMLINGLAVPLDEAAASVCASRDQAERYRTESLIAVAWEMRVPDASIPAIALLQTSSS